jgi:hypothetical protein
LDVRWSRYSNLEDSRFTTFKCSPGKGLAEEVVEALGPASQFPGPAVDLVKHERSEMEEAT